MKVSPHSRPFMQTSALIWLSAAVGSVLRNWPQVFSILNLFGKPSHAICNSLALNLLNAFHVHSGAPAAPVSTSTNPDDPAAAHTEPLDEEALAEREKPLPQLVRLQFGNGE